MGRLYVVRHAIAVPAEDESQPDDSRPLSIKGRRRFRRAAKAFARVRDRVSVIFTSPLVRAVQTAEMLAGALRLDDVRVLEELRPGHSAGVLLGKLAREAGDSKGVMLVGHNPQLSELLASLAHLTPEQQEQLELKKGAIVRLDVSDIRRARAEPRWWLRPASRSLVKGLPLRAAEEDKLEQQKPKAKAKARPQTRKARPPSPPKRSRKKPPAARPVTRKAPPPPRRRPPAAEKKPEPPAAIPTTQTFMGSPRRPPTPPPPPSEPQPPEVAMPEDPEA